MTVPGLVIAAVPERGDPRDALVGSTLADLAEGAEVATGSLRRQAQLATARPDLRFVGLRGNMATRIAKAADHDAVVVAATALDRLGLADQIAERLPTDSCSRRWARPRSPSSAARTTAALRELLASIEHRATRRCVDAERAFLAELGGDCSLPAAAYAVVTAGGLVAIEARLLSVDGQTVLRHVVEGDDEGIGTEVARVLLDDQGGRELLGRTSAGSGRSVSDAAVRARCSRPPPPCRWHRAPRGARSSHRARRRPSGRRRWPG